MFRFKDREPYDLVSGVVYEYTRARWNSSYYGETERHLEIRSGEHLGISSLTFKKIKPPKKASIRDHLLQCDNNPSFDEFTFLAHGIKNNLLKAKERKSFYKTGSTILNPKTAGVQFSPLLACGFPCNVIITSGYKR